MAISGVAIEVVQRIDDVDPQAWDALCSDNPFARHRWLRLAEALLADYEPRYVLARRDGHLDAAAVLSIGRRFKHQTLERRLGWALRCFPLVRCAAPVTSSPGLLVAPRPGASDVVPSLLAAIRRQALANRALFVTYGQSSADDPRWIPLSAAGFQQYGRQTDMLLPIAWDSTEEYLASLPGSDRRKIGKLERRSIREGVTVERLRAPLENAAHLQQLIGSVLARHGTRDVYVPDFLECAHSVCGDDLQVVAAWRDGEVIGCAVALREADTLVARWLGLDYARSWGTSTYRLLIFRIVQLAIALGVRTLSLGPTASDTKADFGAVASERISALAVLAPIPASLVGAAAQLVAGRAAIDPTYSSATAGSAPALPG
ncbi:MAG: GNAT family N-acetyltransferase [Chloroflexi bacterium]|nr:GNAT family N-acetyltransferase [Chloroflexota bacterium]